MPGCKVCGAPPVGSSKYCIFHDVEHARKKAANRALGRGDYVEGALSFMTGALAGFVGQELQKPQRIAQAQMFYRMRREAAQRAQAEAAQQPVNPFPSLGLDKNTATVKDVRRVQRELARIWHAGDQENAAAQERMKEVNQAADQCIRILQGKDEDAG